MFTTIIAELSGIPRKVLAMRIRTGLVFTLAAIAFGAMACRCFGQDDPLRIRVETREVVVPVRVEKEEKSGSEAVRGLSAANFRVFEDGKEQSIKSIAVVEIPISDGIRNESHCTARGVWAGAEVTPELRRVLRETDPHRPIEITPPAPGCIYLLSYVPPPSPKGSCHKLRVKLANIEAKVYARDEYCNIKQADSDPLLATNLGSELEAFLASAQPGGLPLSARVGWSFGDLAAARVHISLGLPWKVFRSDWDNGIYRADIAVLGRLYREQAEVSRFSDTACAASAKGIAGHRPGGELPGSRVVREALKSLMVPSLYSTQMELAPGAYTLKVAVTDGQKFGRVDIPVEIPSFDRNKLTTSTVILSERFRKADERDAENAVWPSKYVPLVSRGTQFTPAGDARFRTGEPLAAYFEIYEPLLAKANATTKVEFRLRIVRVDTGEVKADSGLSDAVSYVQVGNPVIPISQGIAIGNGQFPVGAYRIEVQARDSTGQTTEWRTTTFTIE